MILYGYINNSKEIDSTTHIGEAVYKGVSHFEYDRHCYRLDDQYCFGKLIRDHNDYDKNDKGQLDCLDRYVIQSASRLCNRGDLIRVLNICGDYLSIDDNSIIVKAFSKWGNDFVNFLEGNWVITIWDNKDKELSIFKDFNGSTGLFYSYNEFGITFCSSIKGVLNHPDLVRTPNIPFIINSLIGDLWMGSETIFSGIHSLHSSSYIKYKEGVVKVVNYCDTSGSSLKNTDDRKTVIDEFKRKYSSAIKKRVYKKDNIGATLSGGLDSGSVVAIASKYLKENNKDLDAFIFTPNYLKQIPMYNGFMFDEYKLASSHLVENENLKLRTVNGANVGLIEALRTSVQIHSSINFAIGNSYWIIDTFIHAKKHGVDVLLNGQLGNITISWINKKTDFLSLLKSAHKNLNSLKSLIFFFIPFLRGIKWQNQIYNKLQKVLKNDIKNGYNLKDEVRKSNQFWNKYYYWSDFKKKSFMLNFSKVSSGGVWQNLYHFFNIETFDPTADKELTEFCLSLQDGYFDEKYLIRESMKGILPEEVRLNTKIGIQGIDVLYMMRRDLDTVLQFVELMKENSWCNDVFDLEGVISMYEEIVYDNTGDKFVKYGKVCLTLICSLVLFNEYFSEERSFKNT